MPGASESGDSAYSHSVSCQRLRVLLVSTTGNLNLDPLPVPVAQPELGPIILPLEVQTSLGVARRRDGVPVIMSPRDSESEPLLAVVVVDAVTVKMSLNSKSEATFNLNKLE
jgi:hypothetical protein